MSSFPRALTGAHGVIRWQGKSGASFDTRDEAEADTGKRLADKPYEITIDDTLTVVDCLRANEAQMCRACVGREVGFGYMAGSNKLEAILNVLLADGRIEQQFGCMKCQNPNEGYRLKFRLAELLRRGTRRAR